MFMLKKTSCYKKMILTGVLALSAMGSLMANNGKHYLSIVENKTPYTLYLELNNPNPSGSCKVSEYPVGQQVVKPGASFNLTQNISESNTCNAYVRLVRIENNGVIYDAKKYSSPSELEVNLYLSGFLKLQAKVCQSQGSAEVCGELVFDVHTSSGIQTANNVEYETYTMVIASENILTKWFGAATKVGITGAGYAVHAPGFLKQTTKDFVEWYQSGASTKVPQLASSSESGDSNK